MSLPRSHGFSPTFYFRSFTVLGLIFRSMNHFELIFIYDMKYGSIFVWVYEYLIVLSPFGENTVLFFHWRAFIRYKISVVHICLGSFWTLFSIPLVYMPLFMPRLHSLNHYSLQEALKSRRVSLFLKFFSHFPTSFGYSIFFCIFTQILEPSCQFLPKSLLLLCLGLCWIHRSIWGAITY